MDVDGCFEPSQAACLSLNAKGNHHDPETPMSLGHDKLTKADLWRSIRMIWMQRATCNCVQQQQSHHCVD
jgi:hypothetical protein